jgi:hypothetical protein
MATLAMPRLSLERLQVGLYRSFYVAGFRTSAAHMTSCNYCARPLLQIRLPETEQRMEEL